MGASITVRFGGNLDDLKKALSEGKVLIQDTSSSMDKLASKLGGSKAKQDAETWVGAIRKIGDATKLTTKDQESANQVMERAIAYYKAAGQQVPAEIQKIANATRQAATAADTHGAALQRQLGALKNFGGALGVTFGAAGILQAVRGALSFGDSIVRMSQQTGIGIEGLQRLGYAAKQSGNDLDQVTGATSQFLNRLSEGSDDTVAAVNRLGLSVEGLLSVSPDEAFLRVSDAMRGIGSAAERTQIAMDLFGKSGAQLLPTLTSDMRGLGIEAERTGQVMDELTAIKLDRAGDEIEKLQNRFTIMAGNAIVGIDQMGEAIGRLAWRVTDGNWADRLLALLHADTNILFRVTGATPWLEAFGAQYGANQFSDRPDGRPPLPGAPKVGGPLPTWDLEALDREMRRDDRYRVKAGAAGEDWFGLQAIDQARGLITLVGRASEMTAEKQGQLRARLLSAAEAADQLGRRAQAAAFRAAAGLVPLESRALALSQLGGLSSITGTRPSDFDNSEPLASTSLAGVGTLAPGVAGISTASRPGLFAGFGGAFQQLPQAILATLQGGGNMGQSVGGLLGTGALSGIGSRVGEWAGKLTSGLGKTLGGMLGNIIPGVGGLLGAGLGSLFGKLFGPSKGKVQGMQADQDIGALLSQIEPKYGGWDAIRALDQQLGTSLAGMTGSKNVQGLKELKAELAKFNAELERNKKLQSDLAAVKPGQLVSPDLLKQLTGGKLTDETKEAVGQFMSGQAAAGVGGIGRIASGATFTSQAGAAGVGAGVAAMVAQLREQGLSSRDIVAQVGPAVEELQKKFAAAGLSGGAAFDAIAASVAYLNQDGVAPLLDGAQGVTDLMVSLANLGRLDQETFAGLATQINDTRLQLEAQGKGGDEMMAALAPNLQTIWELQQRFGYEVDASTQALLDQAAEAGKVGEAFKSPTEQMLTAIEKLVGRMGDLVNAILGVPGAAAEAGDGIRTGFPKEIRIPVRFDAEGDLWEGGWGGGPLELPEPPHMAAGGVVTRPTYALIGESGPEAVIPLQRLRAFGGSDAATSSVTNINITHHITAIDRAGVREFVEKEAIPAINEAVAANARQARTNMLAALGV